MFQALTDDEINVRITICYLQTANLRNAEKFRMEQCNVFVSFNVLVSCNPQVSDFCNILYFAQHSHMFSKI